MQPISERRQRFEDQAFTALAEEAQELAQRLVIELGFGEFRKAQDTNALLGDLIAGCALRNRVSA